MVARVVREFAPVQVILFGSYARGEAGRDSDVDLLVVLDRFDDRREAEIAIRRALRGSGAPKDVVVASAEELARDRDRVGSVVAPALREGRLVYKRA